MPRAARHRRASCGLPVLLAVALAGCSPAPVAAPVDVPAHSAPAVPDSFTVLATGDILIHQGGSLVAGAGEAGHARGVDYDFSDVLNPVTPLVEAADLAICHLETPVAAPEGPFRGYPSFSVQPQILDALAGAGYDTCSTASNHSLDTGFDGLVRTLDALDAAGLGHTGTFRTAQDSRTPQLTEVGGARVAHLAWTFGVNGVRVPDGKEWSVNVFDPDGEDVSGILEAAAGARAAGADVVIVSLHCCEEYGHDPTADQVAVAAALLASPDVDLVLGHHAHVVQPFERIGGKWVAYGLGNHIAQHSRPGAGETEDSVIARFTFTRGADGRFAVSRAEAVPTRIDLGESAVTVVPTGGRGEPRDVASHDRVAEILDGRGGVAAGLVIANG